jgi:hypothetical protein
MNRPCGTAARVGLVTALRLADHGADLEVGSFDRELLYVGGAMDPVGSGDARQSRATLSRRVGEWA